MLFGLRRCHLEAIDINLENKFYKTTCSQEIGLINFDVFSEREKLMLRTQIEEIWNVYYHHKQIYLIRYAMPQRKYLPFKLHKKPCNGITQLIQTFISIFNFTCGNFHSWNENKIA